MGVPQKTGLERNLMVFTRVSKVNPGVDSSTRRSRDRRTEREEEPPWLLAAPSRGRTMHELTAVLVAVLVPVACLGLILWLQRLEETLDADVAKTRADTIAKGSTPAAIEGAETTANAPRQERSTGRAVSRLPATRSASTD